MCELKIQQEVVTFSLYNFFNEYPDPVKAKLNDNRQQQRVPLTREPTKIHRRCLSVETKTCGKVKRRQFFEFAPSRPTAAKLRSTNQHISAPDSGPPRPHKARLRRVDANLNAIVNRWQTSTGWRKPWEGRGSVRNEVVGRENFSRRCRARYRLRRVRSATGALKLRPQSSGKLRDQPSGRTFWNFDGPFHSAIVPSWSPRTVVF